MSGQAGTCGNLGVHTGRTCTIHRAHCTYKHQIPRGPELRQLTFDGQTPKFTVACGRAVGRLVMVALEPAYEGSRVEASSLSMINSTMVHIGRSQRLPAPTPLWIPTVKRSPTVVRQSVRSDSPTVRQESDRSPTVPTASPTVRMIRHCHTLSDATSDSPTVPTGARQFRQSDSNAMLMPCYV